MAAPGEESVTSDRSEVPESSNGVEPPPADSAVKEEEEKGGESAVATAAVVANIAEEDKSEISERQASSLEPGTLRTAAGVGSRTFTMRELLDEVKQKSQPEERSGDDGNSKDSIASYGQDNLQQQYVGQNDIAMDLINNISGVDEEGRSRQRILAFAARRYAAAIERNPEDHDAFYNWALVLQESADNVSSDSSSPSKDALLEEACRKYDEATRLCPTLHDAFYNWAIAISDRAKMRGRTKEAEELWKQATNKYEKAVQLNWNSPQVRKIDQKQLLQGPSGTVEGFLHVDESLVKVDVPDIVSVAPCADLTLPPGAGLCIETVKGSIFLVADTWDSLDGWLDAIRLVYTIYARGKSDVLAGIITG